MAEQLQHGSELVLGGQRSGKSRWALTRAQAWLARSPAHRAVFVATAQAWDEEMRERIARHRMERSAQLPAMLTVEEPVHLAQAIAAHSQPNTLVVVDCLTLWLTNLLMAAPEALFKEGTVTPPIIHEPVLESNDAMAPVNITQAAMLLVAVQTAKGPLTLVSNEIGWGVIPMGAQVRQFVDELGRLNQDLARVCDRVTLMAAGLPLFLKDMP
jgi:adenosylcobinamide kinase / adenosylcobinamide-phosphate guanylyltransferase